MSSPKEVAEYIKPIVKGKSFCDLSCQDGRFLTNFKECKRKIAIDKDREMCSKTAKINRDTAVIHGNFFEKIPSAEVYYVFTHTYDYEKIYDLIPDGTIIFSAPEDRWEERKDTLKRLDYKNGIKIPFNIKEQKHNEDLKTPYWTLVIVQKIKSNESTIHIRNGRVFKIYGEMYYDLNERFNRKGEAYFLEKYKSPFFVKMKGKIEGGIELEYAGEQMGKNARDDNDDYVFDPKMVKKVGKNKIKKWLDDLEKELKRLGIEHRDINPANILYNEGELKLIDFTWATEDVGTTKETEKWQAPFPDKKYINLLKKQL